MRDSTLQLAAALRDAEARWDAELARLRRGTLKMSFGLLLATMVFGAMFAQTITPDSRDPRRAPRSFSAHVGAHPRTVLERHFVDRGSLDYMRESVHPVSATCVAGVVADGDVALTPGSRQCDESGCRMSLYAALERGESLELAATAFVTGSRLELAAHVGSQWQADDNWRTTSAPFGPRLVAASLTSDGVFRYVATTSAWHRVALSVPITPSPSGFRVCAAILPAAR